MRNTKNLTKAILLVLIAMLLASLISVTAFADHGNAYNLVDGVVDFEDYNGTENAHAYLYDKLGMYFSDLAAKDNNGMPKPSGKVTVRDIDSSDAVNYAMVLTGMTYVDGTTNNTVPTPIKYAMNKDILDLFFSANGPQKYTLSYDMTINADFPGTSANSQIPISDYRGTSVISIGQYNYLFKATGLGVGKYENTGESITVGDNSYTLYNATEGDPDKGWLYGGDAMQADMVATSDNGIADSSYKGDPVVITSAIAPSAMEEGGGAIQYTKGKPFTVKMEFTRKSGGGARANVYIDVHDGKGDQLLVANKDIPVSDLHKAYGIRIMDTANTFEIFFDNFSLDINESCVGNHGGFGSVKRLVRCGGAYYVENYCKLCDVVYGDKIAAHGESVAYTLTTGSVTPNAYGVFELPANSTKSVTLTVDGKYVTTTASPYRISFDLKVNSVTASGITATGSALLGYEGAGYYNILRMWPAYDAAGNMLDDRYIVRITNESGDKNAYVGTVIEGESYSFDVIVTDPSAGKFDVYMNGEYAASHTISGFKFTDTNARSFGILRNFDRKYGAFEVSNLSFSSETGADNHEFFAGNRAIFANNGGLTIIDECVCGEKIYSETKGSLYDPALHTASDSFVIGEDGTVSMNGYKRIYSTGSVFGAEGEPFWLAFDMKANAFAISGINVGTAGANALNFGDNYSSILRAYRVATDGVTVLTDGSDYDTTRIAIMSDRDGRGELVGYFELNKTISIALYCDPVANSVAIYANGKYITTRQNALDPDGVNGKRSEYFIRFLDSDWGNLTLSNIVFATAEPGHTHVGNWGGYSKAITSKDTLVRISNCYCGAEYKEQITGVVLDNIDSVFGEGMERYTAPDGEYWIASEICFDENTTGTLLTLGNTVLVSAEELDGVSKADVAICVNGYDYTVYVNGEKIKNGSWEGETVITYGNEALIGEDFTSTLFIYNKIVTIGLTDTPVVPRVIGCEHINSNDDILCDYCEEDIVDTFTNVITILTDKYESSQNTPGFANVSKEAMGEILSMNSVWLTFDLTPVKIPSDLTSGGKSLLTWIPLKPGGGDEAYFQFLRIFNAKNSDGSVIPGAAELKMSAMDGSWPAFEKALTLYEGNTYSIDIRIEHLDSGLCNYYVYIDGVFYGKGIRQLDTRVHNGLDKNVEIPYKVRFSDAGTGHYIYSDAKIIADHEHISYSDNAKYYVGESGIEFSLVSTCAICGNEIVERFTSAVLSDLSALPNGYKKQSITAPDGKFVILTDINIREKVNGALLTLNDSIALSVPSNLSLPATLSVAVVVEGTGFEVFVDGKFFQSGELDSALTEIIYGNDNFGAYVRYNNNKIATLGVTYTPVVPASVADTSVKSCYHTMSAGVSNSIYYDADGVLNVVYICSQCGERVYTKADRNMIVGWDNNNPEGVSRATYAKFNDFDLSKTAEPYWVSFDVTMLNYPTADENESAGTNDKRIYKGFSLLNIQDAFNYSYTSQLRMFVDGWEPGSKGVDVSSSPVRGEEDGMVDVHIWSSSRDYRKGAKVASLELNKATNFALYIDPATGKFDVYVDGKYMASSKSDEFMRNNDPSIRFSEITGGKFKFENIQVARTPVSLSDNITVIETEATFAAIGTEAGAYESLLSIIRTDAAEQNKKLELLYVDVFTSQLAYKADGNYVLLVDSDGQPITLEADTAKAINYVYDDINGTVRYFIDGILPYVMEGDSAVILGNVKVDGDFAGTASINDKLNPYVYNSGASNHNIVVSVDVKNVYSINKTGTSEILGYQENDITDSIRFVAGIDTSYYTGIGFDLKVYDVDGVTDITNSEKPEMVCNTIYYAINANDRYLYAGRYGYNYFAAITIDGIVENVGRIIEVTPYTMVGDTKLEGAAARVRITDDGYEFVELGNGFTPLPNTPPNQPGLDKLVGLRKVSTTIIDASQDAYVVKGYGTTNYGKEETLHFKAYNGSNDTTYRIVLLKFDISDISLEDIVSAKLSLYCYQMEDVTIPTTVKLYGCGDKLQIPKTIFGFVYGYKDGDIWNEDNVVYDKKPKQEGLITSGVVGGTGEFRLDITDYLISAKKSGKSTVSFWLEGDSNTVRHLRFYSKESAQKGPQIVLSDGGSEFSTDINYSGVNPWDYAIENVTEWLDRWEVIKAGGDTEVDTIMKIESEYSASVGATLSPNGSSTKYTQYPTRTVASLNGYSSDKSETDMYDIYGGLMDESMRQEATGFFYTKKVGDRWWTFDPLGYPFYRVACVLISTGNARQWAAQKAENGYETEAQWAQVTSDRLKELGYNSTGGWSSTASLSKINEPLAQTQILYVLGKYCEGNGLNISTSGSTALLYGILPVFDPEFVEYADARVSSEIGQYVNASYIYGWMSDNELPQALNMLDNSLVLDIEDERFVYSYATAWTFMYLKTGKINPSMDDITDELRKEYRAMVYDRYYKVVRDALDKYAPNHQYLGCRLVDGGFKDEYVMRVSGYWCDVVSLNYYGVWEGDATLLANMQKWAGKPFIITEWYAKGMDACTPESGLTNESGAGWTVATQDDRGLFYENYALQLLECKGCVGFDWFRYLDNDPTDTSADLSNINSNKGIIDNNGKEYTALTEHMDVLNNQKYNLINFFDARN